MNSLIALYGPITPQETENLKEKKGNYHLVPCSLQVYQGPLCIGNINLVPSHFFL